MGLLSYVYQQLTLPPCISAAQNTYADCFDA